MGNKLNVTDFAAKHKVSRMTVLRRIKTGELPAEKIIYRSASRGVPERAEWMIAAGAAFTKYQAGRPPKPLEVERAIAEVGGRAPARKRRPAAVGGVDRKVVSIFSRRGAR